MYENVANVVQKLVHYYYYCGHFCFPDNSYAHSQHTKYKRDETESREKKENKKLK